MRISDWSSTCALPISGNQPVVDCPVQGGRRRLERSGACITNFHSARQSARGIAIPSRSRRMSLVFSHDRRSLAYVAVSLVTLASLAGCKEKDNTPAAPKPVMAVQVVSPQPHQWAQKRSEEHTSELQSLMRISYAVFCLTKKKKPPR